LKLLIDIGLWFINTRLGQIILLSIALMLAVYTTYKVIDHRAYERGVTDTKIQVMVDTALANQKQARKEHEQRVASSKISKSADTEAEEALAKTDTHTNKTKEVIRDAYRKPPISKPLPGSCARPLDSRVQTRINEAVDRANSAGSPLSATGNPTDQQSTAGGGLGRSVRPAERSGSYLDHGVAWHRHEGTGAQADRTRLLE